MRIRLLTMACGLLILLPASSVRADRPVGLDVSVYCPLSASDWVNIRNSGRTFAFARASYGWGGVDGEFVNHVTRGTAAGVYMGAYHFEYAGYDANHTPINEANTFLSVARNYITGGYLRPVLDVEYLGSYMNGLTLTQWCTQWMDYVYQQTGVQPLIYCNLPWAQQLDSSIKTRDLWWAAWPTNPNPQTDNPSTDGWAIWRFWQYAGDVPIPGVTNENVDLDVFNGTLSQMVASFVINPSQIVRSPSTLAPTARAGLSPANQTFSVYNNLQTSMNYTITFDVEWLTVNPATGTSTGPTDVDTITVTYSTSGLEIGTYTGTITIVAGGASNSPQTIGVTLTITPVPGDLDADGDIDIDDATAFFACLTGPNGTASPNCTKADLDHDGDVDQSDYGILQRCTRGPIVPADPNCPGW